MNRDPFAAAMHNLILWGFIALFIATTLVFLEHDTPLHFLYGNFYLAFKFMANLVASLSWRAWGWPSTAVISRSSSA